MRHEVFFRLTKNPDTLATAHCQQCFGRSEKSPRELPRSKEQRRSSVLLWMCRLMSSCLPNFEMQSEYRSRCVERFEPHAEECTGSVVSLNVCQHCSCTSVHILCTPANVVTSALAQVFSKTVIHGIESQHSFNCFLLLGVTGVHTFSDLRASLRRARRGVKHAVDRSAPRSSPTT